LQVEGDTSAAKFVGVGGKQRKKKYCPKKKMKKKGKGGHKTRGGGSGEAALILSRCTAGVLPHNIHTRRASEVVRQSKQGGFKAFGGKGRALFPGGGREV